MSMLAEPRKKQKWSVDPRNSTWSNDDSKFGQKMLERMGWSKGKGLGRSEQGATDHIKVKLKNNNHGLGASASHEDNWIAHQDDFNALLAQLNNCHGQNDDGAPQSEEEKSFSLEEKSKTSKKRVHYMKFTKGKDLSSRSETDLNCIFGKRSRSTASHDQETNSRDSPREEDNSTPVPSEVDPESITKTVTSSLTMQEYFAKRMAQLKKARGRDQSASVEETDETSGPSSAPSPTHCTVESAEETKKKKKKKKKTKKDSDDVELAKEDSISSILVEQNEESVKKKRKVVDLDGTLTEKTSSLPEEMCPKKKKLKKSVEIEQLNGHGPTDDQTSNSEVKHKKEKKCRANLHDTVEENEEEHTKKKSKKKKKSKCQD